MLSLTRTSFKVQLQYTLANQSRRIARTVFLFWLKSRCDRCAFMSRPILGKASACLANPDIVCYWHTEWCYTPMMSIQTEAAYSCKLTIKSALRHQPCTIAWFHLGVCCLQHVLPTDKAPTGREPRVAGYVQYRVRRNWQFPVQNYNCTCDSWLLCHEVVVSCFRSLVLAISQMVPIYQSQSLASLSSYVEQMMIVWTVSSSSKWKAVLATNCLYIFWETWRKSFAVRTDTSFLQVGLLHAQGTIRHCITTLQSRPHHVTALIRSQVVTQCFKVWASWEWPSW